MDTSGLSPGSLSIPALSTIVDFIRSVLGFLVGAQRRDFRSGDSLDDGGSDRDGRIGWKLDIYTRPQNHKTRPSKSTRLDQQGTTKIMISPSVSSVSTVPAGLKFDGRLKNWASFEEKLLSIIYGYKYSRHEVTADGRWKSNPNATARDFVVDATACLLEEPPLADPLPLDPERQYTAAQLTGRRAVLDEHSQHLVRGVTARNEAKKAALRSVEEVFVSCLSGSAREVFDLWRSSHHGSPATVYDMFAYMRTFYSVGGEYHEASMAFFSRACRPQ